ncbi:hypothetical protein [Seohaeicola zhoushanensis]|uniref:Uncharacterized protein n=1 Tax=Seohaeicola zhoushanensis TaxID=1569283 RepID=A0A8J3MAI4_9RHOB|nr:hypothetical protein [Seohaeicola zhoushanensis]GHF69851.1 hypothetical protein GCM10017056_46110 [Seohaeicola zhoushanensis]
MTERAGPPSDPKHLVREAYRIEGITEPECRSIFLDWALSLPAGADVRAAIETLLATYGDPEHPMTEVLRAGLERAAPPRRRGGWRSRPRGTS